MARKQVDHYIPLFGRDFLTATAGWTAEERGHYITLLIVQWEQGAIPSGLDRLELVSPGITAVWSVLEQKFPACEDGMRRNARMEQHREKCQELKEKRSESGRLGGRQKANGKQNESKTQSKTKANSEAKQKPPTPTPTPTSSLREENTHTPHAREADDEFRKPGWAASEWDAFCGLWNATKRAARWEPLVAPSGWVDAAASPGWLDKARQALARLPRCEFFENPLAVTKFIEPGWVDRILAGEFDQAKRQPSGRPDPDADRRSQLARKAQEFAGLKPAPYRRPHEVVALADSLRVKEVP